MKTLLLALLLASSLVPVFAAEAQGGIEVVSSGARVTFPDAISFSLEARSDASINKIVLEYTVSKEGCAQVVSVAFPSFQPGKAVSAEWSLQTKKTGGLPPGVEISYRWIAQDDSGARLETAPASVQFDDGRFNWRRLSQGMIDLHWYQGSEAFAKTLMDAAQGALRRVEADTGVQLEKPAHVYIYNGAQALRGALIFPSEYTGGIAFGNYGIIALGVGEGELAFGTRAVAHELTHLLVERATFNCYNDVPTWLNEGLAMYAEGEPGRDFREALDRAVAKDAAFPLRTLSGSFPSRTDEAILAYAQSRSVVAFLIGTEGKARMQALFQGLQSGVAPDEALKSVYGFDTDSLDGAWRRTVGLKPRPSPIPLRADGLVAATPSPSAPSGGQSGPGCQAGRAGGAVAGGGWDIMILFLVPGAFKLLRRSGGKKE